MKGHIRRECSRFNCTRCNRRGHWSKECYTNLNREYQPKQMHTMQRRDNLIQEYQQRTDRFKRTEERCYLQRIREWKEQWYKQERQVRAVE